MWDLQSPCDESARAEDDPAVDQDLADSLAAVPPDEPLTVRSFTALSAAVAHGLTNLCYANYMRGDCLFWITDEHADMIGTARGGSLDALMQSGDEQTPASMRAIARAAHHPAY